MALPAAFFSLVGCGIAAVNEANLIQPLVLLGGTLHLAGHDTARVQELALISLRMYGQEYAIALVFFGAFDFLLGWLIVNSTFLPRLIGVLLLIAGPTWVGGMFAIFLSPQLTKFVMPVGDGGGHRQRSIARTLAHVRRGEYREMEDRGRRIVA